MENYSKLDKIVYGATAGMMFLEVTVPIFTGKTLYESTGLPNHHIGSFVESFVFALGVNYVILNGLGILPWKSNKNNSLDNKIS